MEILFLQIFEKFTRPVCLDKADVLPDDPSPALFVLLFLHCLVIIMSAAQFGPHGIYKDFGPAVTHFFNQAQCFLGILTEYQFENSGFEIPDIAVNDGLRFGIVLYLRPWKIYEWFSG